MLRGTLCKLLQRQTYDVLSHRWGTLAVLVGFLLLLASAFQFGEVALEWSREKYAAVFNSFSDNVASRSFRARLCLPVPIDVVYTWVNGSDPSLLADLRKFKTKLEIETNQTKIDSCTFPNCIALARVVMDPPLPLEISLRTVSILYPAFKPAKNMRNVVDPTSFNNITMVEFESRDQIPPALSTSVMIRGKNSTVKQVFLTSDITLPNAVKSEDIVMMSGFPHTYTEEDLKSKLPKDITEALAKFELHSEKGIALLMFSDVTKYDKVFKLVNLTMDGKMPTFSPTSLVWDLQDYSHGEDLSSSRFEDNEELRYSLRSIEKHAPWVRHIYIVSNGQIPYWLNMENSRVTLVTHKELFANESHLPTFSSPAIESHIHKIPGLSDKFVYMNDDVMFGKEVWPDDFYTHAQGQKVYLTWPVPNCQEGCPTTWIRDGYCDKACNNTECDWDGGDCEGGGKDIPQFQFGQVGGGAGGQWQLDPKLYCNAGCANNWIADKYCDQACNIRACGFDAGDCGTGDYDKLYQVSWTEGQTDYHIPAGEIVAYFNLTDIFGPESSPIEGSYNESDVIRSVVIAQKFRVLTVVLLQGVNTTTVDLEVKVKDKAEHKIVMHVNTMPTLSVAPSVAKPENNKREANNTSVNVKSPQTNVTEKPFLFKDIPEDIREPHKPEKQTEELTGEVKVKGYALPKEMQTEYDRLNKSLTEGELTDKGFQKKVWELWNIYKDQIKPLQADGDDQTKNNDDMSEKKSTVTAKIPMKVTAVSNREDTSKPDQFQKFLARKIHWKQELSQDDATLIQPSVMQKRDHIQTLEEYQGSLPWEKQHIFDKYIKSAFVKESSYETGTFYHRRLLDTFADSLRHVNRIYNRAFGYVARKVPAHIPHMIDRHVVAAMQKRFPEEWDTTSSHKIRSSDDMQYAFSYFYYLMSQPSNDTIDSVFNDLDTDHSGILSDREIRTLVTRLYDLPLDLQTLTGVEVMLINCSQLMTMSTQAPTVKANEEKYYVKEMPQITKELFVNCSPLVAKIQTLFKEKKKYKFETAGDEEVAFKMIRTNVTHVVQQLDDIRKNPKKFACLNDNIDHSKSEAHTVKAVLQDFYESLFPLPSQFELPMEYRNRFLHMDELKEWRKYRDFLRTCSHYILAFLVLFSVYSYFSEKIDALCSKIYRRIFRSQGQSQGRERKKKGLVHV